MSYAQAIEQQISLMREMHRPGMQRYAINEMGCEESGQKYLQQVHDIAETAEPYYWSPEMVGVIDGVWRNMPEWTLRRESLQSHRGFFWFAKPFTVPCPSSENGTHLDRLVGLLWGVDETLRAPGVPTNVNSRERGSQDSLEDDPNGRPCVWLFAVVNSDGGDLPATGKSIPWFLGWSRAHLLAMWPEGGPLRAHNDAVARIFSACLAFIEQRIVVSPRKDLPRPARKRAEAAFKHEPLVRVVELRRRQSSSEHDAAGDPVAWSCRWVVSGHWRQQYFPSSDEHRPIWVMPYVKGPEDKPLKPPRAKVFAVVR